MTIAMKNIQASMLLALLSEVESHGIMGSEWWDYETFTDNFGHPIGISVQQNNAEHTGDLTSFHFVDPNTGRRGAIYENGDERNRAVCSPSEYWSNAADVAAQSSQKRAQSAATLVGDCSGVARPQTLDGIFNGTGIGEEQEIRNFFCCPGYHALPFNTPDTYPQSVCPIRHGGPNFGPPPRQQYHAGSRIWGTHSYSQNHGGAVGFRVCQVDTQDNGEFIYEGSTGEDCIELQFYTQDDILYSDNKKYRFMDVNESTVIDESNDPVFDPVFDPLSNPPVQGVDRNNMGCVNGSCSGTFTTFFDLVELRYPDDYDDHAKRGKPLDAGNYVWQWYWTPKATTGSYVGCSEIEILPHVCTFGNNDCGDDYVCKAVGQDQACQADENCECVSCIDDSHCTGSVCVDNQCVECNNAHGDVDCNDYDQCYMDNTCVKCIFGDETYKCQKSDEICMEGDVCKFNECNAAQLSVCQGQGEVCNPEDGECVECLAGDDSQCGPNQSCNALFQCEDNAQQLVCDSDWHAPCTSSQYCNGEFGCGECPGDAAGSRSDRPWECAGGAGTCMRGFCQNPGDTEHTVCHRWEERCPASAGWNGCHSVTGVCLRTASDSNDCDNEFHCSDLEYCNREDEKCYDCIYGHSDKGCLDFNNPICRDDSTCVQCTDEGEQAECDSGYVCMENNCIEDDSDDSDDQDPEDPEDPCRRPIYV